VLGRLWLGRFGNQPLNFQGTDARADGRFGRSKRRPLGPLLSENGIARYGAA